MDPNAALNRMREIVRDYDSYDSNRQPAACSELVDLVDGLDGWMARGGFAPTAWTQSGSADDAGDGEL